MNPTQSTRTTGRTLVRSSAIAIMAFAGLTLTACGSDNKTAASDTAPAETVAAAVAPAETSPTETAAPAASSVAAPAETGSVFVGKLGDIDHGVVGFHISEPDADGVRSVRVYACDGKQTTDGGFALWFKGKVEADGETTLTAAGRTETLTFTAGATLTGTLTLENGTKQAFDATPAEHGSGIYDVTVGDDYSYVGRSTSGIVFDGKIDKAAQTLSGTATLTDGTTLNFSGSRPHSEIVPGTFVAVMWWDATRKHLVTSGRSGNVRGGAPGLNIINWCVE